MSQNIQNKVSVRLQYGELTPMIDWCKRNCVGNWYFQEDPSDIMYRSWTFLFENERDYVAFTMWKK